MTALERLRLLAGASGTTGAALTRLAGTTGLAGALLVAYSGLPVGTAMQHLLQDRVVSGALASKRPPTNTQRPQSPATARIAALTGIRTAVLQTALRPLASDTDRTPDTATVRPAAAAIQRAAQISSSTRPANTGGRRK